MRRATRRGGLRGAPPRACRRAGRRIPRRRPSSCRRFLPSTSGAGSTATGASVSRRPEPPERCPSRRAAQTTSPTSQIAVRPAPRTMFMSPPGAVKPVGPEDGDRLDRLLDERDRPEHGQPVRDLRVGAEAEDGDGADHRHRRPGEERAPEDGDVEESPSDRRIERVQRERSPDPGLDGGLDDERGCAEQEDAAVRFRQQAADNPGDDREGEGPEGRSPGIGAGRILVVAEPGDDVGRGIGRLGRRAEGDRPDQVQAPRRYRGEDQLSATGSS